MTNPESAVTELVNISTTTSTALPTNKMVSNVVATRIAETQLLLKDLDGNEDLEFSKNVTL